MPWIGGGTTLSQGDRSGATKNATKMDGLAKIMVFKHLKRLIMCLNTPFVVFSRLSLSKGWYGREAIRGRISLDSAYAASIDSLWGCGILKFFHTPSMISHVKLLEYILQM